jgi:Flp pilus assembly protein TadD
MEPQLAEALDAFRQGQLDRARDLAQRELDREPASAQIQHLLGLIDCRTGRMDSGVDWLRRAADAEPANLAFRVMLVRALVDSGRAKEALEVPAPSTAASPAELALWHARAEAAARVRDRAEAARAWEFICAGRPDDWAAWTNLARARLALEDFAGAELAYRQALTHFPAAEEAIYELGLIYERTGRFDQLAALLDDALGAGVAKDRVGELWAIRERHEGRLEQARDALRASRPRDPVRWHRLRNRIADELGDAAEAFDAAKATNEAVPDAARWRQRAAAYRQDLRDLARTITPQWAERLPAISAADRPAPVFLLGFPRSGTTLLDTFLMGHPEVTVIEEKGVLRKAEAVTGPPSGLADRSAEELEKARAVYFAELDRYADHAAVVIDKAPLNMLSVPLIQVLFPGARIIFAQRHPCDAVLSGFMQSFAPNLGMANFLDLAAAADFYDCAMSVWSASCEAFPLNAGRVVYEELVDEPEAVLRPLVNWLGLDWHGSMLDHRSTAARRGPVANTSYDQITRPLTSAASGRWKRYEKQLEPILPALLPWAHRLGYRD